MEWSQETVNEDDPVDPGHNIIRHSLHQHCSNVSSSWFELRVFYVRISKYKVDSLAPEFLTLIHIPVNPDTQFEINGVRSSMHSKDVPSLLRRDRVDKKSEEATFVSTDSIRTTGNVKFEVFAKDDLVLSGVLEMSNNRDLISGDLENHSKRWSMNCETEITMGSGFLKANKCVGPERFSPTIEVYVAGCSLGTPIILTKTLQLGSRKKHVKKGTSDSISEYETTEYQRDAPSGLALQISGYEGYKSKNEEDYNTLFSRTDYIDGDDGELSWFNAGVSVGVGIGLGICLGIGIGIGLLVRTYQATNGNFNRRLT